jgi:uncharacterized protein (TIRG00374 family)
LGVKMRRLDLSGIGFVSIILNQLMSGLGAAGYSVRFMLMNRHGVRFRDILAISLLHFYLSSVMMIVMLPVGTVYLALNAPLPETAVVVLFVLAAVVTGLSLLAAGVLFWDSLRERAIEGLIRVGQTVAHRDVRARFSRFEETMARGVQAMCANPATMAAILVLVLVEWVFSVAALSFCLCAFGIFPSPGELISGFVIGTVAGVMSLVPGRWGVQEGSMAGIFTLYGYPLESAILASILYRFVFLMVPYAVSLAFYRRLLRGQKDVEVVPDQTTGE